MKHFNPRSTRNPTKARAKILAAVIAKKYFSHLNEPDMRYEIKFRSELLKVIYSAMADTDLLDKNKLLENEYKRGYADGRKGIKRELINYTKGKAAFEATIINTARKSLK